MELILIQLTSGDTVLGKHLDETDETITIGKPMQLMLDPTQGGVGMIPYMAIFTQQELPEYIFNKDHVIGEFPVHESFAEAYIKQTTGNELGGE
jgi:hypothetical protein